MAIGIGDSTIDAELSRMQPMTAGISPISDDERRARIEKAQYLMRQAGIGALYLDASTNLYYFTGMRISPSERLHGAVIPATGEIVYLSPAFEEEKTRTLIRLPGAVYVWEEHEDPTALVINALGSLGYSSGTLAVDPFTPFFTIDGLRRAGNRFEIVNGTSITTGCRQQKSPAEIALLKRSNEITLEVHRAVARILTEGMSTLDVRAFVEQAYRQLGAVHRQGTGLYLFGEATAYPHGTPHPQILKKGDMVLTDMGAELEGYRSDITRSYVFGEPSSRQRSVWDLEKSAQAAAFAAAQLGTPCEAVDAAARSVIESGGFGPGYALPGLPHRTGHGIGLDVHEETYIVKGNRTPLAPGMCFSNEPTICIYGEFGCRLEDCVYMTEQGPEWFTKPAHTIDDPFGYDA